MPYKLIGKPEAGGIQDSFISYHDGIVKRAPFSEPVCPESFHIPQETESPSRCNLFNEALFRNVDCQLLMTHNMMIEVYGVRYAGAVKWKSYYMGMRILIDDRLGDLYKRPFLALLSYACLKYKSGKLC